MVLFPVLFTLILLTSPQIATAQFSSSCSIAEVAGCAGNFIGQKIFGAIGGLIGSAFGGITGGGAQVPVLDNQNLSQNTQTRTNSDDQVVKEDFLDCLAWTAAKYLICEIGAQVIDWVESGFEGNPAFIDDPGGFFLDIADQAAASFLFDPEQLAFLCSPIKGLDFQIRIGLFYKYFGSTNRNRSCSLTDIINNLSNTDNFLSGGFDVDVNGTRRAPANWDTWLTITQVPENNMYGAAVRAEQNLADQVSGQTEFNKMIAGWNDGFKSVTDSLGKAIFPGDFIKSEFKDMFGSDRRALEAADELSEVLSKLAGALFNQAFSSGMASLGKGTNGEPSFSSRMRSLAVDEPAANPFQELSENEIEQYRDNLQRINEEMARNSANPGTPASQKEDPVMTFSSDDASQKCTYARTIGGIAQLRYDAIEALDDETAIYSFANCVPSWWHVKISDPANETQGVGLDAIQVTPYRYVFKTFTTAFSPLPFYNPTSYIYPTGTKGPYLVLIGENDQRYDSVTHPTALKLTPNILSTQTFVVPQDLRGSPSSGIRIKGVALESGTYLMLSKVTIYKRIKPVINTSAVLKTMLSTAASTFNPLTGVTGIFYEPDFTRTPPIPGYNNPKALPSGAITYEIRDQTGQQTYATLPTTAGTYTITYTATAGNPPLTSTVSINVTVTDAGTDPNAGGGAGGGAGGTVIVPDITKSDGTNMTLAEARTSLGNRGFIVGSITSQDHPTIPPGYVISFSPSSGSLIASGSTVNIVFSQYLVPNLIGLTDTAARSEIVAKGYTVGSVRTDPNNCPFSLPGEINLGEVCAQTPLANTKPTSPEINFDTNGTNP